MSSNCISRSIVFISLISPFFAQMANSECLLKDDYLIAQGDSLMRQLKFVPPRDKEIMKPSCGVNLPRMIFVDGIKTYIEEVRLNSGYFFWTLGDNEGDKKFGMGAVILGNSSQDVASEIFTALAANSSMPIEALAKSFNIEYATEDARYLVDGGGKGYCAYFEGSLAIWVSGFKSDVVCAKRMIASILEELHKTTDSSACKR